MKNVNPGRRANATVGNEKIPATKIGSLESGGSVVFCATLLPSFKQSHSTAQTHTHTFLFSYFSFSLPSFRFFYFYFLTYFSLTLRHCLRIRFAHKCLCLCLICFESCYVAWIEYTGCTARCIQTQARIYVISISFFLLLFFFFLSLFLLFVHTQVNKSGLGFVHKPRMAPKTSWTFAILFLFWLCHCFISLKKGIFLVCAVLWNIIFFSFLLLIFVFVFCDWSY